MSALNNWPQLEAVASLGETPPDGETDLGRRFDLQIGKMSAERGAWQWEPTPFGEALALSILTLTVRTAEQRNMTPTYEAMETQALDRIMAALKRSVIREVRKASEGVA